MPRVLRRATHLAVADDVMSRLTLLGHGDVEGNVHGETENTETGSQMGTCRWHGELQRLGHAQRVSASVWAGIEVSRIATAYTAAPSWRYVLPMWDREAQMILIPSVEILSGQVVRLAGATDDEPIVLSRDPLSTVRELRQSGAMFFHIVDLDAVLGKGNNNAVLARLAEDMVPFQVRGRITTPERADEVLELGADRIVLGSLPYQDGYAARELVKHFGMRVMGTLDVKGDHVLIDGNEDGDPGAGAY